MPPRSLLGKPQKAKFPTWPGRPAGPQNVLVFCPLLRSPFPPKDAAAYSSPRQKPFTCGPMKRSLKTVPFRCHFLLFLRTGKQSVPCLSPKYTDTILWYTERQYITVRLRVSLIPSFPSDRWMFGK